MEIKFLVTLEDHGTAYSPLMLGHSIHASLTHTHRHAHAQARTLASTHLPQAVLLHVANQVPAKRMPSFVVYYGLSLLSYVLLVLVLFAEVVFMVACLQVAALDGSGLAIYGQGKFSW